MLVVGIIIAVLALLLSFSVTLYVSISDAVRIKVGMFGIKFDVKSPEHDLKAAAKEAEKLEKEEQNALKKKKKKGGGKKKKTAAKSGSAGKQEEKDSFSDTVFLILNLIKSVFSPSLFVLRHTRLAGVYLDMAVGTESADKTALTYAGIGIAVSNTLAFLKSQIKVRVKHCSIRPDFTSDHITQQTHFKVKIRLGVIIWGGLGMLTNIIRSMFLKTKEEQTPTVNQIKEGVKDE